MKKLIVLTAICLFSVISYSRTPEDNFIKWRTDMPEGEMYSAMFVTCDPNGQRYEGNFMTLEMIGMPSGMDMSPSVALCETGTCITPPPEQNEPQLCHEDCIIYGANVSWVPDYSQAGVYMILLTVADKAGNNDNVWWQITVTEVDNVPPVIRLVE